LNKAEAWLVLASGMKVGPAELVGHNAEDRYEGTADSVGIVAALYVADQLYAHGKYTDALQHMLTQMRHSFGV
jgi:thioredoxin-like negative regulator of GroEL